MSTAAQEKNARVIVPRHVKRSKSQRKFVNQMRAMGDVPWPARRFRIAPTFGGGVPTPAVCARIVVVDWKRRPGVLGWVRKPLVSPVACGAPLVLLPFKRQVHCPSCVQRAKRERMEARILKPPPTAGLLALRVALQAASVAGRIFGRRSHT